MAEGQESVHSGDIFLGERVASVRDEEASFTDSTVSNNDQFDALQHSRITGQVRG